MIDQNYNNILEEVLKKGSWYDDPNRKDVKRLEIPSYTFRHEFRDGFPAISTKKLAWKSVVTELIWFLKGDTNIKYLIDNGCNIWNKDAYNYYLKVIKINSEWYKNEKLSFDEFIDAIKSNKFKDVWWKNKPYYQLGDLGKVYGHYWRNFNGVDQIAELIHDMINKPMSSELLVVARDPSHKEEQALPCCHYFFQIIMKPLKYELEELDGDGLAHFTKEYSKYAEDNQTELDYWNLNWYNIAHKFYPKYGFELHWNQRSCDLFLGIPFNIASYALLALILEKITGHKALGIQGDWKKVHLYDNSIKAAEEQLTRKPSEEKVTVEFDNPSYKEGTKFTDIDMFLDELYPEYFELKNYNPQPAIKVEMLERR